MQCRYLLVVFCLCVAVLPDGAVSGVSEIPIAKVGYAPDQDDAAVESLADSVIAGEQDYRRGLSILFTYMSSDDRDRRRAADTALRRVARSSHPRAAALAAGGLADEDLAWVLRLGGEFVVDEAKPGKPVVRLDMRRGGIDPGFSRDPMREVGLARLERFSNVEELILDDRAVSDSDLQHVARMSELQSLSLHRTAITRAGLRHLRKLENLTSLNLARCHELRDADLQVIGELKSLESLDLSQCPSLTGAGMEHLKVLPRLRSLKLEGGEGGGWTSEDNWVSHLRSSRAGQRSDPLSQYRTGISDDALVHFRDMPELRALSLRQTQITDEGLDHIAALSNLESLDLSRTVITDAGVARLSGLRRLQSLDLSLTLIGNVGLRQLAAMEDLRELGLAGTGVSGFGLQHLSHLKEIRTLDLYSTAVDDEGIAHLRGMTELELLSLGRTAVTLGRILRLRSTFGKIDLRAALADLPNTGVIRERVGMQPPGVYSRDRSVKNLGTIRSLNSLEETIGDADLALIADEMPDLEYLNLTGTRITDIGLGRLAGMTKLERLLLTDTAVSDRGLEHLAQLHNLRFVGIRGTAITLGGVRRLLVERQGRTLTEAALAVGQHDYRTPPDHLDFRGCRLRDDDLAGFHELTQFNSISMSSDIGDAGLAHLGRMRHLEILWVSGPRITEIGLDYLSGLRKLRVLWLTDTRLADSALSALEDMPALEVINLSGAEIDDASVELFKRLKALEILIVDSTALSAEAVAELKTARPNLTVYASQKRAIARVRGFERTSKRLEHAGRRDDIGAVGTWIEGPEPLIQLFGDAFFEVARWIRLGNYRTEQGRARWPTITRSQLEHLHELPTVESVDAGAGAHELAPYLMDLPRLRTLNFSRADIRDADLAYVAGLTNVEEINLERSQVTDAGLIHLRGLKNLRKLQLGGYRTDIGDDGIAHLAELVSLQELTLRRTNITDAALVHLHGLSGLKQLDLTETDVSFDGVAAIERALPECEIKHRRELPSDPAERQAMIALSRIGAIGPDLSRCVDLDRAFELLASISSVTYVRLGASCTDEDVERLVALPQAQGFTYVRFIDSPITDTAVRALSRLGSLSSLELTRTRVEGAGLAELADLPDLRYLYLRGPDVSDATLVHLEDLRQLRSLGLRQTAVTGAGLDSISSLPNLTTINLTDSRLSDAGLVLLRESRTLWRIDLVGTGVSDAGLEHLMGMDQLRHLTLGRTAVTEAGAARLRDALPQCNISLRR